jgi:hypothetical protein
MNRAALPLKNKKNMSVKRLAAVAVATIAIFSVNAQSSDDNFFLDRGAEEVIEYRKSVNDASVQDIADQYADVAYIAIGNEVGAGLVKAIVQDKAYQGISVGPVVGGETFASKFSPIGGLSGAYQFRKIRLGVEGYVSIGYPDKLSDDQSNFLEWNVLTDMDYEIAKSKDLTSTILGGVYGSFKASQNAVKIESEHYGFRDRENAFNVGGGLSLMYIYSPKWSSVYHCFQLRVGANHKLHSEKEGTTETASFGGKKAYFQASISYKLMFGLGKRHTKQYNVSLLNQGYTKAQIRSLVGLK